MLEAVVGAVVVMLTRLGFCAPQGFWVRQLDWQACAPLQLLTHWLFCSVHSKYGIVWEYCDAFGDMLLLQMQV